MSNHDPKATLHRYLQIAREAVRWKLEDVSEYDVRRPLTPTGTNLLGVVKHLAYVEAGYFGDTFGRPCSVVPPIDHDTPNVDMFATAAESREDVLRWHELVGKHADETIDGLEADAPGRVPWWGDRGDVTLHQILVHMVAEMNRHLGQIDILRESLDGAVGHRRDLSNLDDDLDWPSYVERLEGIAESFR